MRSTLVVLLLCGCGLGAQTAAEEDPLASAQQAIDEPAENGGCRNMHAEYEQDTPDGYSAKYSRDWVCITPPSGTPAVCEPAWQLENTTFLFSNNRAFTRCQCVGWGQGTIKYFCNISWFAPGPEDLDPPVN